ncbi:SAV_2336 N-terminal domain-related protein [Streptomyces sp. NBC_01358]|uniref:SAV_2336 N-terminal domain-related protein n=1 Tax=Streptomyces sp. NBC_01358 TaxID=2903837 RepID=UPI002E2F1134|nr:SAV_2336 N-terminal domain-related protein [Streptomyces sp. NBC_01358]
MSDTLARLLRALSRVPLPDGADASTLADAVWLAASGVVGEGTEPSAAAVAGEPAPDAGPGEAVAADADTPQDARTAGAPSAGRTELSLRRSGSDTTVRGVPLSLGRADPLPDALAVGRAIQPFRRPWRRGGRNRLDVEATVEHYARGGPLVPLFRPAPEPWFEAVVLVDSSLSMSVWEETSRAVIRLLNTLGGFRAVHTWRLEWQGTEPRVLDHHGREVLGTRVPHHGSGTQGRRLVLVLSDCAARGWHAPAPWLLLREWGRQIPVALLDPLPPRLWRRSALNLPAVRVAGGRAGGHNGSLRFTVPPRLRPREGEEPSAGPWSALPVLSCTPHSLGAWANTLMRADPAGCGAVLVPATGRLPRGRTGQAPAPSDPALLAEAFVHTAPAPAVRLAVLCSVVRELPLPLLHVLRDQAVPEAAYADLAEVLTSGLFAVRRVPDGDPVLALHASARTYLRTHLTTHDAWQARAAFGRHAAARPYAPQGIAAVLHDVWATTELPVEESSLADSVAVPSRPAGDGRTTAAHGAPQAGAEGARPVTDEDRAAGPADPADEWSAVMQNVRESVRAVLGRAADSTLQDAEILLRELLDWARAYLPAPLGLRPGQETAFDHLRELRGRPLTLADVVGTLAQESAATLPVNLELLPADDVTGRDIRWHCPGGPLYVTVALATAPSDAHAVEAALGGRPAVSSVIEFVVVLDESDKPDGLMPLERCVAVVEREGPRPGVAIVIRLQTLYGPAPSDSPAELADALRALHSRAGRPTHSELIRQAAGESPPVILRSTTLYEWFTGQSVPKDTEAFDWLTHHLVARADPEAEAGRSLFRLAALRHHAAAAEKRQGSGSSGRRSRLGRPVAELVAGAERLRLPPYHVRDTDLRFRDVVRDCAAGASVMALLVGPPGSGKSRSSVEAARLLPGDWWLWEPGSVAELEACLDSPSTIRPRTVVWLDNADRYLLDRSDGGRGERVAAGLRTLLHAADRGPVLVLGSLRTEEWTDLTTVPPASTDDAHAQARTLCEENLILEVRATQASDVIERYLSGTGVERAVVDAAVDACRCGHGPLMSGTLLSEAARDYLSTTSAPSIAGDVSVAALAGLGLFLVSPGSGSQMYFRLSDDIVRFGRERRSRLVPPESLWNALADHASAPDLEAIARAAHERGDVERAERFRSLADSARADHGGPADQEKSAPALRKLLRRTDLSPAEARAAADEALAWLRADLGTESAQYVLNGLLPRTGLSREQTTEAVQHALNWLDAYGYIEDATFVVAPLLTLTGLDAGETRRVVEHAVRWLGIHGEDTSAQFVLRPLLQSPELSQDQIHSVAYRALNWLDLHGGHRANQFVLSAALRRNDLPPGLPARFVALGLAWLRSVGTDESAKFVLRPLLQRPDLGPEEVRAAVEQTMRWLRRHGTTRDAQFVLNALLYRQDLTREEAGEAGEVALDWLLAHGRNSSARYVLRPLLERTDLSRELPPWAVEVAAEWSRARFDRGESDGGVQQLLSQRAGDPDPVRSCVVLIAEIAGYSDAEAAVRAERQRALHGVLAAVQGDVSDVPCERHRAGDGEMLLFFPHETRRALLVREVLRTMESALHEHAVTGELRLRVALHAAEVGGDEKGRRGQALATAARLVDSPALRAALDAGGRSPVAAVMSAELFSIAFPDGGPLASTFRPVYVTTKEDVVPAWISVAGFEEPPGIEAWTRRAQS